MHSCIMYYCRLCESIGVLVDSCNKFRYQMTDITFYSATRGLHMNIGIGCIWMKCVKSTKYFSYLHVDQLNPIKLFKVTWNVCNRFNHVMSTCRCDKQSHTESKLIQDISIQLQCNVTATRSMSLFLEMMHVNDMWMICQATTFRSIH